MKIFQSKVIDKLLAGNTPKYITIGLNIVVGITLVFAWYETGWAAPGYFLAFLWYSIAMFWQWQAWDSRTFYKKFYEDAMKGWTTSNDSLYKAAKVIEVKEEEIANLKEKLVNHV